MNAYRCSTRVVCGPRCFVDTGGPFRVLGCRERRSPRSTCTPRRRCCGAPGTRRLEGLVLGSPRLENCKMGVKNVFLDISGLKIWLNIKFLIVTL